MRQQLRTPPSPGCRLRQASGEDGTNLFSFLNVINNRFSKGEIMAPAAPKKLDQDVPTTRGHWYPQWILFTASRYGGEVLLAKREVVGQAVCDFAIESGNAIPVPRDKQAVAEAMYLVKAYYPELVFIFHRLLATQAHAQGGWYIFLEAAARKFAGYWSGGDIELEEWAVQQWASWYKLNLPSNDVTSFNSRFVLLDSLDKTKTIMRVCIQSFLFYENPLYVIRCT
jgi:hypothetical protein